MRTRNDFFKEKKALMFTVFLSFTVIPLMIVSNTPSYTTKFLLYGISSVDEVRAAQYEFENMKFDIQKVIDMTMSADDNGTHTDFRYNTTLHSSLNVTGLLNAYLAFADKFSLDGSSLIDRSSFSISSQLEDEYDFDIPWLNISWEFADINKTSVVMYQYNASRAVYFAFVFIIYDNTTDVIVSCNSSGIYKNCNQCGPDQPGCVYGVVVDEDGNFQSYSSVILGKDLVFFDENQGNQTFFNFTKISADVDYNYANFTKVDSMNTTLNVWGMVINDATNPEREMTLPVNISLEFDDTLTTINRPLIVNN